jgi:hypothetical protein
LGFESVDSNPGFEGCGLEAKCENRGQRPQRQWRRRRLIGSFGCGTPTCIDNLADR